MTHPPPRRHRPAGWHVWNDYQDPERRKPPPSAPARTPAVTAGVAGDFGGADGADWPALGCFSEGQITTATTPAARARPPTTKPAAEARAQFTWSCSAAR